MIIYKIIPDLRELKAAMQRGKFYAEDPFGLRRDAARLTVPIIKIRTSKGERADGGLFHEYTDRYKEVRKKHNRPVAPVDLDLTGKMMGSIEVKDDGADVVITVPDDLMGVARGNQLADGPYNKYKRPFFGVTESEKPVIGTALAIKTRNKILG